MQRILRYFFIFSLLLSLSACKLFVKQAAKGWTKKQVNAFITKCEDQASLILGEEKAIAYCDCAVDVVAERYPKFEDVEKLSVKELLKVTEECKGLTR